MHHNKKLSCQLFQCFLISFYSGPTCPIALIFRTTCCLNKQLKFFLTYLQNVLQLGMEYERDLEKNRINLEKHGAFESAVSVFEGFYMIVEDTRRDYREQRFCTMGVSGEGEL